MTPTFPDLRFQGTLRPSQRDVVAIARDKLAQGRRQLHIVAPPGSGKTVLGLYLWAECVRKPALVLSPNSAIQAQWAAKTSLFESTHSREQLVSTDPRRPALLTSLTYQSVTVPRRGDAAADDAAIELWTDALIEKGQAQDPAEAAVWIADLARHNQPYYEQRLAAYRKRARDQAALAGAALDMLHPSALRALERLRDNGLGLVIFDECHHLMEHWGRVLATAHDLLGEPIVVGLTATPPDRDGKQAADIERYDSFFGPIDYEVPVPAVVKDGFLAPYQDLAYFVRPTADELQFVAQSDRQLREVVDELDEPSSDELGRTPPLVPWLTQVLTERRLPTGAVKDWPSFERRDSDFAMSARLFLIRRGLRLPADVPRPVLDYLPQDVPELSVLVPVLDRYVRHALRRSPHEADRKLAERTVQRLRMLGVQITETGCQACASPVGRVLAYSRSKVEAIVPILAAEHRHLGRRLRAVVVADYEKTSATTAEVADLLDAETGGAVAAFKHLVRSAETEPLNPILVTGSSVLVDDDLWDDFRDAATDWLSHSSYDARLDFSAEDGFHMINGSGADWCPRVYVEMITELFQRGLTKCLIGTRGLLGEGWDANKINVLIDLTTVTTSMTVNQLRGRSIRLDPEEPDKLSDNWDIVCFAPEFTKGLDDYKRFLSKHATLFGVTEDGAVEKGAGHVHAAFATLKPDGLENSYDVLNREMLARVALRAATRERWRVGQPYRGEPKQTIEAKPISRRERGGFPPFAGSHAAWSDHSLSLAIGHAILGSLREAGLIASQPSVTVNERAGGYVRVFLEQGTEDENRLFAEALHETLAPLQRPRYVVPRDIVRMEDTFWSRAATALLPVGPANWLNRRLQRRHAERVMWHAAPTALAKNKDLVEIFQRHWNRHVSPGDAVYVIRGEGESLVEEALATGRSPSSPVHSKEIFL